jgi:hypothetical protein
VPFLTLRETAKKNSVEGMLTGYESVSGELQIKREPKEKSKRKNLAS